MTLIRRGQHSFRVAGASRWRSGYRRSAIRMVVLPKGITSRLPVIASAASSATNTPTPPPHTTRTFPFAVFWAGCSSAKIPQECYREYGFAAEAVGGPGKGLRSRLAEAGLRNWRFDFAWPLKKLAVEVDGGAWTRGRHTRGAGFIKDQQKRNMAILLGWRVLHYTPDTIDYAQIAKAYAAK